MARDSCSMWITFTCWIICYYLVSHFNVVTSQWAWTDHADCGRSLGEITAVCLPVCKPLITLPSVWSSKLSISQSLCPGLYYFWDQKLIVIWLCLLMLHNHVLYWLELVKVNGVLHSLWRNCYLCSISRNYNLVLIAFWMNAIFFKFLFYTFPYMFCRCFYIL